MPSEIPTTGSWMDTIGPDHLGAWEEYVQQRDTEQMAGLQTTAIKIRGFGGLPVGWHYGEGIPPPPLGIELALKVEQMLRDCGYSQTDAFPGCGGEIQVTWYRGGCSVTIEVTDEGRYKEAESNV